MTGEGTSTEAKISAITDTGKFERLATSILRIADPVYSGIVHTGINASGQTISDPLDGISICKDINGKKYVVAVEHTITARKGLAQKWLNELEGDLPKAIESLKSYRGDDREYIPRVVLTCKVTPSSDLVMEAEELAESHSIELDIWSNDRLANQLDISPDGQTIRRQFFGVDQTRLSSVLAREISIRQMSQNAPPVSASQLVRRDISVALPNLSTLDSSTVFLCGDSGSGKTSLCHQMALDVIESGGLAYVLSHGALEDSDTLSHALRKCLVNDTPSLIVADPINEISKFSGSKGVFIWIEDVNASRSPANLISKIQRLTAEISTSETSKASACFKVYCPVWPDNLKALPDEMNRSIHKQTADIQRFSRQEGRKAIRLREIVSKSNVSDFDADSVCERLAYDPLLIGLWVGQSSNSEDEIISEYVSGCLKRCSQASGRSISSLKRAVLEIGHCLLGNRSHNPSMNELYEHFGGTDVYVDLESLCVEGGLFREVLQGAEYVLGYRHDRVRDHLLIDSLVQDFLQRNFSKEYLADPFYYELVAKAALSANAPDEYWDKIEKTTQLILFCALKHAWKERHPDMSSLLGRCLRMVDAGVMNEIPESVRRAIEWQIAGLEGDRFASLIRWTSENLTAGREARILNGDVSAAAKLCYVVEPCVNSPYRDRLVAHARAAHGDFWKTNLKSLIRQDYLSDKSREAALYLAGECADTEYADAISACWESMVKRGETLTPGMLYAVVGCVSGVNENLLQEVFEVWISLPEEDPKCGWRNPRFGVAKYCLSGGLRRIKSNRTLKPLLDLADSAPEMRHAIYGCLEQIDHPLAATYVATYIAEIDKRFEGEGHHNHVAHSRLTRIGFKHDRNIRHTAPAMNALKLIWSDLNQSRLERKRHFQLWCLSINKDQLNVISKNPPKHLENEALHTRCRMSDKSAIPALREKILDDSQETNWFSYIHEFDSCYFEDLILSELQTRSEAYLNEKEPDTTSDFVIPTVLAERRDDFAEGVILEHWHHLKDCWPYPHLLLYLATPKTLELYDSHYQTVENKEEHFKLLNNSFGIRYLGRSGVVEIEQLVGLEPYLNDFDDRLINTFWDECTKKGFVSWRKRNLDSRVTPESWIYKELNDEAAFSEIDEMLASERSTEAVAYQWSDIRYRHSNNVQNLIDCACRYVKSRDSAGAADFLGKVISIKGTRADLTVLERPRHDGLLTSMQVEDVTFAVQYRSLI